MDNLLKWRSEFPILDRSTYLISNSLGAMPRGVYQGLHSYADSLGHPRRARLEEGWWEMAVGVGDFNRSADRRRTRRNFPSTRTPTITQAVISSCFDFRGPRNKIVMVDLEFPSVQYFYHEQARKGARIEVVPSSDDVRIDLDKFPRRPSTKPLCSSPSPWCSFRSSCIVERSRHHRTRPPGRRPRNPRRVSRPPAPFPSTVRALGVDFAVGGVLKWLCGGPGVAYLYVREDLRTTLRPALNRLAGASPPFLV